MNPIIKGTILDTILYFNEGSKIYIKPSNRGKFTAKAKRHNMSALQFASHVLANKEDYSSSTVKLANFARNAAHFKHKTGGKIIYFV